MKERVTANSLTEIDAILQKNSLHIQRDEVDRLWSDTMNVIMASRSKARAKKYLNNVVNRLGPDGERFRIQAEKILHERFVDELVS